jgi:hypothetical protein
MKYFRGIGIYSALFRQEGAEMEWLQITYNEKYWRHLSPGRFPTAFTDRKEFEPITEEQAFLVML